MRKEYITVTIEPIRCRENGFFDVGAIWVVTMVGGPLRDKSYNDVVFKMTRDDYNDRLQRIPARGLELKEGRSRVEGEGRSIYCYDNDNHMFELHSCTAAQLHSARAIALL